MAEERRAFQRGRLSVLANPIYRALRASAATANTLIGALGIFLVVGLIVAAAGTALFVEVADNVRSGSTEAFDGLVMRWVDAHHLPLLDAVMLEITALGTGIVVLMIVAVAALFLILTRHKYPAILLLASTFGGFVLNAILKLGFDRPRPSVVVAAVHTFSSSFPSGHAMSAAVVYSTVAYLAARLLTQKWAGWLVMTAAMGLIAVIAYSRIYLGVHYPSDVVGGVAIGLAWAAFCMATLEAIQKFWLRLDPRVPAREDSAPSDPASSLRVPVPAGSSTHR
jgi:undecaprenyl-diphosphatase